MNYNLMIFGAIIIILICVAMIKPRGKKKNTKSKYSKADLISLAVAAVVATVILILKIK
ncbi:hypothetical protein N6G94_05255 [Pediococcus inopinatus]|uniref:hypothetical protein n=1 Tax=Pediococcus inopinatus TaxID=114090 RepID=UPI002B25937B|nr:hypothetical protein [Pediococcus inopinatus]WPC16610.1 hypothetical protein N6G94_05255 [Pediococcus inopinatus]